MDRIKQANFTTLSHAVEIGDHATVLFLLETGADPEQRDAEGRSPLTLAVQSGQLTSVGYLLEYGANPEAPDSTGKSPLELARGQKLTAAVNILTGAASETSNERPPANHPRMPVSRRRGRWAIIRTIVLWTAGAAVAFGAFEMRHNFNVDASQTVFDSINTNEVSRVSRLLVDGYSANIKDADGNSALLYAANRGRMDIVRLLLKNHADPNLGTPHGISALERAGIEHADIVAALLDSGADPNRVDAHGKTLLAYACTSRRYSNVVALLLKHRANPNVKGENGSPLLSLIESGDDLDIATMKLLLTARANPNATDSAGTPALVWSAEQSSVPVVKLLLDSGAKTKSTDNLKRTALDAACHKERSDIVLLLLDNGADPNAKDKDGNTAAMYAISGTVDAPESASNECASILRMLSQHGAKLNATNGAGRTASQIAAELGYSSPGLTRPN